MVHFGRNRAVLGFALVLLLGVLALAQSPVKSPSTKSPTKTPAKPKPAPTPRASSLSPARPTSPSPALVNVSSPSQGAASPDNIPIPSHYTSEVPCSRFVSCDSCAQRWDCVWCETSALCLAGDVLGPKADACNDWRFKQCVAKGSWLELGVAGALLLLMLLIVALVLWRCCRTKAPSDYSVQSPKESRRRLLDDVDHPTEDDDLERPKVSLHPKNDQKRLELSEKYGVDFGAARVRSFNGMGKAAETNPFKS